jgi:hypothetical protein
MVGAAGQDLLWRAGSLIIVLAKCVAFIIYERILRSEMLVTRRY